MAPRSVIPRLARGLVLPLTAAALALAAAGLAAPERVSVAEDGAEADSASYEAAVSANGRFVAFRTSAANLVQETVNGNVDIVLRDRRSGTNRLVSHTPSGADANGPSGDPAVSGNGRFVLFYSSATDLVDGDVSSGTEVFLADMRTGGMARLSTPPGGGDGNGQSYVHGAALSKNGRYAVFYSQSTNLAEDDANGKWDVFLHDRVRGTTTLVSRNTSGAPANGDSMHPSISPNGRYVAYHSVATDLVEGETGTNSEVYVFDTKSGATTKASPGLLGADATGGSLDPVVSDNGRWVAFFSYAYNLVPEDTNQKGDVFVYDRKTGEMRRVSVAADGTEADGHSYVGTLPANGQAVVFFTESTNLVAGDANGALPDVILADLRTGALRLLSADADGAGGDGASYVHPAGLSANGRWAAIYSAAENLVADDANGTSDVFVVGLQ